MTAPVFRTAALALTLSLVSCSKFDDVGTELHVRYDSSADKLVVIEAVHGVHSGSSGVADAATALGRASEGRRIFPASEGIAIDFDEMEEHARAGEVEDKGWDPKQMAELAHNVKVMKSGMFLDEQARLSLFRVWEISRFKSALEFINQGINRTVVDRVEDKEGFKPSFPVFDVETRDLQQARAKSHSPWLSTDGDSFVLDVPMTPQSAARCVSHLISEAAKPDGAWIAAFYRQLSSLEIKDKHAVLRFAPGADEFLHFEWKDSAAAYSPSVLDYLKENKSFLDETATWKQIRETMKPR